MGNVIYSMLVLIDEYMQKDIIFSLNYIYNLVNYR
jgi:hypothetical protein